VPLGRYRANLERMTQIALDRDIRTVIVGPAPHDDGNYHGDNYKGQFESAEDARSNKRNQEYSDSAQEVADNLNVPFVNLFDAFTKKVESGDVSLAELLPDTIHFSDEAYKIYYAELLDAIRSNFPELKSENIKPMLPSSAELEEHGNDLDLL